MFKLFKILFLIIIIDVSIAKPRIPGVEVAFEIVPIPTEYLELNPDENTFEGSGDSREMSDAVFNEGSGQVWASGDGQFTTSHIFLVSSENGSGWNELEQGSGYNRNVEKLHENIETTSGDWGQSTMLNGREFETILETMTQKVNSEGGYVGGSIIIPTEAANTAEVDLQPVPLTTVKPEMDIKKNKVSVNVIQTSTSNFLSFFRTLFG